MASKKGGVLSKVPLPDTFFSIKHELKPIASISVSAPSAILIYLLTIGGFVACWVFYSQPNPPQTVTLTQSEWQKEGYQCNPLQKESHYKKMWNYDECLKNVREPNDNSVVYIQSAREWNYYPLKGVEIKMKYPDSFNTNYLKQGTYATQVNFGGSDFAWYNNAIQNFGGGYGCQCADDKPVMVNLYKEFLEGLSPCDVFKENAPFQCSKTEITYKSELEKLSLSIANTQLLFGVLTAFFAYMFYKMKKNADISPTDGGGWEEAAQKLKEELTTLRMKVEKCEKQMV